MFNILVRVFTASGDVIFFSSSCESVYMHDRAKEFAEHAAAQYGFEVDIHEFGEDTKTAAAAADAVGCAEAQIVKSIVMWAAGDLIVILTSGVNRVNESKLAAYVDVPEQAVRTANADEIKAKLGWSIGGVPPICHEVDVPVLFDRTLASYETVWAAAGTPNTMFPISPEELRSFAAAEPADVIDRPE